MSHVACLNFKYDKAIKSNAETSDGSQDCEDKWTILDLIWSVFLHESWFGINIFFFASIYFEFFIRQFAVQLINYHLKKTLNFFLHKLEIDRSEYILNVAKNYFPQNSSSSSWICKLQ